MRTEKEIEERLLGSLPRRQANKSISVDHKMAKFSKVGKVTVVVRGCYAGKKVVIVKPHDEGPKDHSFLHALVAGIERYPLKITGKHDPKKIAKRTRIRLFIEVINYSHLLPTSTLWTLRPSRQAKKVIRKTL